MLTHYVYSHSRPDTGDVFYIGKGTGSRFKKTTSRNQHWKNIVQKAGGFNPSIIANGLTEDEAFNFEKLLIQQLKLQTDVSLANLNEGGKGGVKPSEETLLKIRLINLGRKHTDQFKENQRQNMLGHIKSEATRKKLSEAHKGKKKSLEHLAKISKALTGKKHSAETKAKLSAIKMGKPAPNKGAKWSQETRDKIAALWVKRREEGTSKRVFTDSHKQAMKDAWVKRKQRNQNDLS